jgi:hypothetical protein
VNAPEEFGSRRIVLRSDPEYRPKEAIMEFRLTYEGLLLGSSTSSPRAKHKHEIRRVLHKQLRQFWQIHPYLKEAWLSRRRLGRVTPEVKLVDHLAQQYAMFGYNFVPLVIPSLDLICAIDILFLRPSVPGQVMQSGDLDNRLKTLFDALRMPANKDELGGYDQPADDERPFFCLLADDKLISHVSVETDTLLQPTSPDAKQNDARLVIAVRLKPYDVGWDNISFG